MMHRYTHLRLVKVIFIQCELIWFPAKLAYLSVIQGADNVTNVYSIKSRTVTVEEKTKSRERKFFLSNTRKNELNNESKL